MIWKEEFIMNFNNNVKQIVMERKSESSENDKF